MDEIGVLSTQLKDHFEDATVDKELKPLMTRVAALDSTLQDMTSATLTMSAVGVFGNLLDSAHAFREAMASYLAKQRPATFNLSLELLATRYDCSVNPTEIRKRLNRLNEKKTPGGGGSGKGKGGGGKGNGKGKGGKGNNKNKKPGRQRCNHGKDCTWLPNCRFYHDKEDYNSASNSDSDAKEDQ
eukprot:585877_1